MQERRQAFKSRRYCVPDARTGPVHGGGRHPVAGFANERAGVFWRRDRCLNWQAL
jgi:hypothetical protein